MLLWSWAALASDYDEGRLSAHREMQSLNHMMQQINPQDLSHDFSENPAETQIDTARLKEIAAREAQSNSSHNDAKARVEARVNESVNDEMSLVADAMTHGESTIQQGVPCRDGSCLPTHDMPGEDFAEGVSELGALSGVAEGARGVKERSASIFTGSNSTCRIAIAGIGNCCSLHARLLRCREDEKNLSIARADGRAAYVGTYCARRKLKVCLEKKESWCVFPNKLAGIIQLQGRAAQLGMRDICGTTCPKRKSKERKKNRYQEVFPCSP